MKYEGDFSKMNDTIKKYSEQIKKISDMLYTLLSGKKCTHSEVVNQTKGLMQIAFGNPKVDGIPGYEIILKEIIENYESEVGIKTYAPDVIAKDRQSKYWLAKVKPSVKHAYFDRYKLYLRHKKFSNKIIENIESSCEEILSYCANPKNPSGVDKKRGLVVGDVQSGKTANYLGLINMAFDYGYKIVVLLAGTTNSLRLQTQKRMDSGVIGAKSDTIGNTIEYIGVGFNPKDHFAVPFTNQTNDFAKFIQANLNATFYDFNKPVVLVVKKVKSILESISERLQSELTQKGVLDAKNILIIDDEADNASVNTSKSSETPTSINKSIRAIFNKFPIASYVGYTATPFANIFIDPHDEEDNLDLFPSDFIVQLHAPDNYFGGRKVFLKGEDHLPRCLRQLNEKEKNFLPVVHEKSAEYPELPHSLKEAIHEFLINNVIRTLRGDKTEHRSMMINITRFNDVQHRIECKVTEYLEILKNAIEQLGMLSVKEFVKNKQCEDIYKLYFAPFYNQIREGDKETGEEPIEWIKIQEGLYDEIKQMQVVVINSRNGKMSQRNKEGVNSRFDYENFEDVGARVIAIGGMVLSRGLTLEGLMTSYYSRNAGTYDTLLQMCRWFGYRPQYQDLCRIYLTQDSIDRFDAVLDAVEDMKIQFSEMKRHGKKPKDFGLMIKESPDTLNTTLLVTSRNKMRGTDVIERKLNYGGAYADTSKLLRDASVNYHNYSCVIEFLKKIDIKPGQDEFMVSGVSKYDVADLIGKLKIPYVNKKFDTEGLSEYIADSDIFTCWDVAIATGSAENLSNCFGIKGVRATRRSFHVNNENDLYIRIGGTNNRVLDPGMFNYGLWLTDEQRKLILKEKLNNNSDSLSALDYLRRRDNPILIIYPIELKTKALDYECQDVPKEFVENLKRKIRDEIDNTKTPLVAFAFGFPAKESQIKLKYRANLVKLDELKNLEIDDDGEGEDDTDD